MANNARTIQDLERKYDFASLLGMRKNIRMNEKSITKVENELVSILNTLIINLKDVLDNQNEVSLWFYPGVPTTDNEPYTLWSVESEHYGDIYYDQETGYVYKFLSNGWNIIKDENLVQAMALTNVEIDTTTDHERKIYFTQPVTPYSSGDWWILEDGTLKICQLGRALGEYEIDDFIIANKYTPTIADADGDIVTIKKGQVIKMSDTFASFTNLATGGSTVINGANITTGTINTDNVTIGNGNVQLDDEGLKLSNGAKVVGENGLMNTYLFTSKNSFAMCGYQGNDYLGWNNTEVHKLKHSLIFNIPEGLNIISAKLKVFHAPTYWTYINSNAQTKQFWGYCRNLKLYKTTNIYNKLYSCDFNSEYDLTDTATYQEINRALGNDGWTPTVPNNTRYNTEIKESIDIKNNITSGLNELVIQPGYDATQTWDGEEISKRTAFIYAMLKIDGYMSY